MYTLFLLLHILGGFVTFFLIGKAIFVLVKQHHTEYKPVLKQISLVTVFELITGFLLFLVTPHVSFIQFCSRIGIYLFLTGAVSSVLFVKEKQRNEKLISAPLFTPEKK